MNLDQKQIAMAWLGGADPRPVITPPGWKPGDMTTMARQDLERLEYFRTENSVEVYRHRTTGQLLYVARAQANSQLSYTNGSAIQAHEVDSGRANRSGCVRGSAGASPPGRGAGMLREGYASREQHPSSLPGPIMFQGVAARLLAKRKATQRPWWKRLIKAARTLWP